MKRLAYPLILVFFSLLSAAIFTAVTATALASYSKPGKANTLVKEQLATDHSTASR
jgi:hypothetical protein